MQNCLATIDTGKAVRTNDAMRESMKPQSGSSKCKDLPFQEESTSPIKFSKSSEKKLEVFTESRPVNVFWNYVHLLEDAND